MNKRHKVIFLILGAALLSGIICYTILYKEELEKLKSDVISKYKLVNSTSMSNDIPKVSSTVSDKDNANAMYLDSCETLNELKQKAEMIVAGKVIKQEDIGIASVLSNFEVSKTYKGDNLANIKVLQLKEGNRLDVDNEYVLFLGKQTDNSGYYFIKGGSQGKFNKEQGGNLSSSDLIMKKELEKLKLDKAGTVNFEEFEAFLNKQSSSICININEPFMPEKELIKTSDLIVRGKILDIKERGIGSNINNAGNETDNKDNKTAIVEFPYIIFNLQINENLSDIDSGLKTVNLVMMDADFGTGNPDDLVNDDEYVVFLCRNSSGTYSLRSYSQGFYRFKDGEKEIEAVVSKRVTKYDDLLSKIKAHHK